MLAIPAFHARTQTALFRGRVSWQRRYQCGHVKCYTKVVTGVANEI